MTKAGGTGGHGIYKDVVRKYALQLGLDPSAVCVHGLRATAATNALDHEADIAKVPHSEVEKLLNGAERYRGAPSHTKRVAKKKAKKKTPGSKGAKKWTAAIKQRKKHALPQQSSARSEDVRIWGDELHGEVRV